MILEQEKKERKDNIVIKGVKIEEKVEKMGKRFYKRKNRCRSKSVKMLEKQNSYNCKDRKQNKDKKCATKTD